VENALHTKYNKKVVDHIPETRQMLGTLNTTDLGQNLSVGERAPNQAPVDAATIPVSENGVSLAPPSPISHRMLIAPRYFLDFDFDAQVANV